MLTSQIRSQRIIPTAEEMQILREKLSNIKDLTIFRNPSKIVSHQNGTNPATLSHSQVLSPDVASRNIRVPIDKPSTKEILLKSSTTTKLINQDNPNNQNENTLVGNNSFYKVSKKSDLIPNVNMNDYSLPEKDAEIKMQMQIDKYNEIQEYLEINKDKIEKVEKYDELLRENEYLKLELEKNQFAEGNQTFAEILADYMRMKSENISMKKQIDDNERHIIKIERENKILKDLDSNTGVNKNYLKTFMLSLLTNNFHKMFENDNPKKFLQELLGNTDIAQFLSQRVDSLEIQNFQLINKIEKLTHIMKNYLAELVEYSEVISDIRNVLNIVYDSQSLTTEFLIIRETLNNRKNYISNQKEMFLEEKEKLDKDNAKDRNMDIILCKDKIVESKVNISNNTLPPNQSSRQNNKIFDILDEKIEIYESLKNNLAQYEDYMNKLKEEVDQNQNLNLAENLMNENYILKSKNIRLQDFLVRLLRNKNETDGESLAELNEITNTHRDIVFSEDLFNMVKSQALIIENNLILK